MKTRITRLCNSPLLFGQPARDAVLRPNSPFLRTIFNSAQFTARPRIPSRSLGQSTLLYFRYQRSALARRWRSTRLKSDYASPRHANPTPHLGSPEPALSVSQRLKQLSREYGWTAVGVYLGLSLLDFPFCFLAVRLLGTDRIGHYEDVVKNAFWSVAQIAFPNVGKKPTEKSAGDELAEAAEAAAQEGNLGADGLAIRTAVGANATIWTQLGLAYIVHKSLIFFRVPLTAAVLPGVVKVLRRWGYSVGKKKSKPA